MLGVKFSKENIFTFEVLPKRATYYQRQNTFLDLFSVLPVLSFLYGVDIFASNSVVIVLHSVNSSPKVACYKNWKAV